MDRRQWPSSLATKITGEGDSYVRSGARVTGKTVRCALEQSLGRLKTDYVDLYQLHWPNRGSYHFRKNWKFDPTKLDPGDMECEVAEILGEVANLRKEGKLREFGLSNESAWGLLQFIGVAERDGLPRPVSVQNEYSLLCRLFDLDLAEAATFEDVGLLAYSPLAAGLLSGKYMDGTVPAGSRLSIQPNLNGRLNDVSKQAVKAYREVADRHGLALNQMALAYCLMRPFMTSVIIGATSDSQLSSNIGAAAIRLSDEVVSDIEAVRRGFPMPI